MDDPLQLSLLFVVLLLPNAIIGECFPSFEENINSTVSWISTPIGNLASNQNLLPSYARGYLKLPEDRKNYVGLEAILDVYGFDLQHDQQSAAFIMIVNRGDGQPSSLSGIQAGWEILPRHYKDSRTHFYVAWTNEGQCRYDICPGFRKTSTKIAPGDVISPVSVIHRHKVFIKLRVFKEKSSGDWHIHYGVNGDLKPVGYFPKSLVSGLINKPVEIFFGALVSNGKPQPGPPMGSGDVPDSGYAASFSGLKFIDAHGNDHLVTAENLQYYAGPENCYPISRLDYAQFFYGDQVVLNNYVILDVLKALIINK